MFRQSSSTRAALGGRGRARRPLRRSRLRGHARRAWRPPGELVLRQIEDWRVVRLVLVEGGQLGPDSSKLGVDGGDGGLVHARVAAHQVGEQLDDLVRGAGRSTRPGEDDRIDDVDPGHHGHQHGGDAQTRGAVRVEVDGQPRLRLELAHELVRRNGSMRPAMSLMEIMSAPRAAKAFALSMK